MNPKAHKEYKINMDHKEKQIIINKLFKRNSVRRKSLQEDLKDTSEVLVQDFSEKNLLELKRLKDTMRKSAEKHENSAKDIKREIATLNQLECIGHKMTGVLELLRKAPNDAEFFATELKSIEAGMKQVLRETELAKSMVDAI